MAFAEDLGTTVVFGGLDAADRALGDTWLFDGRKWRPVRGPAPPARRYAAFGYHPGLEGCVLHGGAVDDQGRTQYGDAWLFRKGSWTALPKHATTVRDDHSLVFDQDLDALVMVGGLGVHPDALALLDSGWNPIEVTPNLPRYQCSSAVYDYTLGGLVLHGGEARHGGPQYEQTLLLRTQPARAQ
jgi:hypothetical protein